MMKFVCTAHQEIRHQDHRLHEPDHDRRHRHVRRLPPDRRRRDEVRLRGRPGLRRPSGRFRRGHEAQHACTATSENSMRAKAACNLLQEGGRSNMAEHAQYGPKKCPMPAQDPNVRNKNFEEVALGYTEEMAVTRPQRCLHCKNKPCVQRLPGQRRYPRVHRARRQGANLKGAYQGHAPRPPPCPPSAAASARRRRSARASACAASRASRSASAVWSALWPTGTVSTCEEHPRSPRSERPQGRRHRRRPVRPDLRWRPGEAGL